MWAVNTKSWKTFQFLNGWKVHWMAKSFWKIITVSTNEVLVQKSKLQFLLTYLISVNIGNSSKPVEKIHVFCVAHNNNPPPPTVYPGTLLTVSNKFTSFLRLNTLRKTIRHRNERNFGKMGMLNRLNFEGCRKKGSSGDNRLLWIIKCKPIPRCFYHLQREPVWWTKDKMWHKTIDWCEKEDNVQAKRILVATVPAKLSSTFGLTKVPIGQILEDRVSRRCPQTERHLHLNLIATYSVSQVLGRVSGLTRVSFKKIEQTPD